MTTRKQKRGRKVTAVAQHRNGIGGEPFYVVTFTYEEAKMVGVVFPEHDAEGEMDTKATVRACRVAVLDVSLLAQGEIAFGHNSWRGDEFAPFLVGAIEASKVRRS